MPSNMLKICISVSLFLGAMSMCLNKVANNPKRIQGIRLTGLGGVYYGRVEVLTNGEWGTICDDDWDDADAKVVCRALGMTGGIAYDKSWFGPGTGNITITSVNCQGFEPTLRQCKYNSGENCCSHREDAGVMCDQPN